MGAFIAGISVATSPIAIYIAESLKPVRDFFLVLFFFSVGASFDASNIKTIIGPALLLAFALTLIKPIVYRYLLAWLGEKKQVAWEVGARLGQNSEFSLVRGKSGWKLVSAKSIKNIFEIFRYHPEKLKVSVNVLSLVKKLVAEEDHNSLFVIVSNFLDFLVNADDDSILLGECLVLLRILHSLGYMRHDPDFSLPLSSLEIETKDLEAVAPRRLKMIELIR